MRRLLVLSLIMAAIAPAAAQVSTLEIQRAAAAAAFGTRLDALRRTRAEMLDDRMKYDRACRGKVTTGRAIGVLLTPPEGVWFLESLVIDNETTPACRMLVTEIKSRFQQTKGELERIDEEARRRAIYPGVMRDLKRIHGFE